MTTTTLSTPPVHFAYQRYLLLTAVLLAWVLPAYGLWQSHASIWVKITGSVGLPMLLLLLVYLAVLGFARLLPALDCQVGPRTDRTVRNGEGNYESTFLTTARESNGACELIRVEIEPRGGNDWHYHKTFAEEFTVLSGQLTVGLRNQKLVLNESESATVKPGQLHYFRNESASMVTMLVRVNPARGLEKSVRVGYGLANTGQWEKDALFPRNPWHLFLLLGYSETYLPHLPGPIQEPLINALARIAQWKGEDRDLKPFFE